MVSTFSGQNKLPTMSVPDLNDTCSKLLEWVEPLITERELLKTKHVVDHFLVSGGGGETLQNELVEWSKCGAISNWSAPAWKDLYLESRAPLPINSNVFYYLKSKLDEKVCTQTNIAAALVVSVYGFMSLVDEEVLEIDMQKKQPLCMNQYNNIFSSIRIPRTGTDEFKVSSSRQHIVVLHRNHIYKIDVLDAKGAIRTASEIEFDLECILAVSESGQNLGLLTSIQRDEWAHCRAKLLDISASNKEAMTCIEQAVFALCLDESKPEDITEISTQLLHGSGNDRFFDKSLQFVVFANGKTGINFEHTGVDGSVMLRLIAHIYNSIDKVIFNESSRSTKAISRTVADTKELIFELNSRVEKTIRDAAELFIQHTANTQTRVLSFTQFGKNQIKEFGVSPDAFVQLALQLAEYKLYGKCYSAYEAVMTRTFLDGRIDVLYTVTPDSMAFIESINSPDYSVSDKQEFLRNAVKKHIERANECRTGQGVYTHLLALKYRYKLAGTSIGLNALPELFTSKGYEALTHSVVCTSTTSEYGVELAGYGPIVDDGYGIRYFTRNDAICFNMTSRTEMHSNLDKMKIYIEQSLVEMAELMLANS
ncbi:choline/carnitine O-acyltransferase [Vibrio algarum]|uniref:Choline/carnitine O-acyltransferase n=1 Tax=Vibrio algarum TaxID=3020714 RepID=A0ABT4YPL7_9VIBR|nr:choline/carnitine O-acyltransferase [Vibrio sp. KJ40-1]MDB1123496.1 choline/carnitine O-acyltransferase [Vibrio sp. KJ40-1]